MSAKKSLNWKEVGQFVATLVRLFSVVTETLKKAKVGAEIIDWVTSQGKCFFVQKLKEIGEEFLRQTMVILRAVIDTNIDPRLPFNGVKIKKHLRQGKVVIEKRVDGLYIDGQKVILYRSERRINGQSVVSYELRKEVAGQLILSASILDFLMANQEYIPQECKERDKNGNVVYIFFWATIYHYSGGRLYVRSLSWYGDAWVERYFHINWHSSHPVAGLASN